jgi:hypothetical protein
MKDKTTESHSIRISCAVISAAIAYHEHALFSRYSLASTEGSSSTYTLPLPPHPLELEGMRRGVVSPIMQQ